MFHHRRRRCEVEVARAGEHVHDRQRIVAIGHVGEANPHRLAHHDAEQMRHACRAERGVEQRLVAAPWRRPTKPLMSVTGILAPTSATAVREQHGHRSEVLELVWQVLAQQHIQREGAAAAGQQGTVPSLAARATYCEPTMPLAPGLLSTRTGCSSTSDMPLAIGRIMPSIEPPLAVGHDDEDGLRRSRLYDRGRRNGASMPPTSAVAPAPADSRHRFRSSLDDFVVLAGLSHDRSVSHRCHGRELSALCYEQDNPDRSVSNRSPGTGRSSPEEIDVRPISSPLKYPITSPWSRSNRPPVNALDRAMRDRIVAVFDEISERSDIRVAVLTGNGKVFCSGADLKDRPGSQQGRRLSRPQPHHPRNRQQHPRMRQAGDRRDQWRCAGRRARPDGVLRHLPRFGRGRVRHARDQCRSRGRRLDAAHAVRPFAGAAACSSPAARLPAAELYRPRHLDACTSREALLPEAMKIAQ